jgi:hypothetical protein
LALVVTVAALPVVDWFQVGVVPVNNEYGIAPAVKVPTLVKLEFTTDDFKVVPLKVPASAIIVISALPSNGTPFIFLVAASFVAVPALPVIVVWSPVFVPDKFATALFANMLFVIAPLAMEVALPTLVTTPVKFALVVTVAALPVVDWFQVGVVPVNNEYGIAPAVKVPTLVKLEFTTDDFKVVPLKVPASAIIVISALPSNGTPFIFLVAASFVAVPALPVIVVWSPVFVPDKFATALFANMLFVIAPLAMEVALPTLVTTPVKFALVVTVAALPVVDWFQVGVVPVNNEYGIAPAVKVPTLVKLEFTTDDFKVLPLKVPASAIIVISALPSKGTPFIFLVAASFVAVPALPVIVVWSPVFVPDKLATALFANMLFVIAPLAMEVTLPKLVTTPVKFALVTTVVALPILVTIPVKFALVVTVAALPVTLPVMGLLTVKFVKVPTLVKLEFTTDDFKVVPLKVPASAIIVISALPSNGTPFIFLVAASFVAVPALPVIVVWSPVFVPDKLATALFANMLFVIAPLAMEVILPTLVTTPLKFALVVTVAALPVILI